MTLTPIKTPLVAKKMFPNFIWDISTNEKFIYLTFDDGPTPEITNWVLDTLNTYQAKATFFCIGKNIENHPDIFQNIIRYGHAIGNHTHNHVKGWKTKAEAYLQNVDLAASAINKHSNNTPLQQKAKLFRPPYGQITPKLGKLLLAKDYKIIMWDVLSFDWDYKTTQQDCLENVISKTTNGSIVVFHDSIKASKNMQYALPKTLEYFSKNGYSFKSLDFKHTAEQYQ
ncbi:polysaccharide deacetylase family protein [Gaetbulibacter saemankumensis]|uniref:polysaccharide deacetylase family protein n=1 Tax=Gaetbulibacter saemankumensis TaxID=311208 RepID=UPI00041EBAEC|nr:polysaccharide deacetylase family protein [Gaetbulibacter saemankumensis]